MSKVKRLLEERRGEAVMDILLGAAVIIFVILPVFSFAIERYAMMLKAQTIKDALDMTNLAVYHAIDVQGASAGDVVFDSDRVSALYRSLLAENLKLNEDLTPKSGSVADGPVVIESLTLYKDNFPVICPQGKSITRPALHAMVCVPVKPFLYRELILDALGKEYVELKVHMDTDVPVNR